MTLKDTIKDDVENIFLNTEEFAELISYNGHEIKAVPNFNETNEKGNSFSSDCFSDKAFFLVSENDVPEPVAGDVIIFKSQRWQVIRYTPCHGMNTVECIKNEGIGI